MGSINRHGALCSFSITRIPVVRLKIVPKNPFRSFTRKFSNSGVSGARLCGEVPIHRLLQIRRDPEYTAQIFSGHRRKKFCRVVQSPPYGALMRRRFFVNCSDKFFIQIPHLFQDKNNRKNNFSGTSEAGEEGLEPPSTVLETAALPLNYSPIFCCASLNAPL